MDAFKFDPKNPVSVISFLESLDTVDSILENSMIIYSSDLSTKKDVLENVLRFGNLTKEELYNERAKVDKLISTVAENHVSVSENTTKFLVCMKRLLDGQMDVDHEKRYNNLVMLRLYETDLSTRVGHTELFPITESSSTSNTLTILTENEQVTPFMILDTVRTMVNEHLGNGFVETESYTVIRESLVDRLKKTVRFEANHSEYYDLPIIRSMGIIESELFDEFAELPEVKEKISDLFDYISDELESLVMDFQIERSCEEHANPNPFDIYQMTPFNVGTRSVAQTFMDIANADTDEQIEEAVIMFGRMNNLCKIIGPEILTEAGTTKVAKAARAMARKSDDIVNGPVKKVNDEASDIKTSLKKTADPMVKFVESTMNKLKSADEAERRRLVSKGGWARSTLLKIWRWVKRSIGILIVGQFGSTGALIGAIALIGFILTDAYCDAKVRADMLRELEDELAIVEEKIEDSRGEENRQKKYELMRIRNSLKTEIKRVSLRLKY